MDAVEPAALSPVRDAAADRLTTGAARGGRKTMMTTTTAERTMMVPADWRDFLALTKPRVMSLVVFTALCGLLAAPGHVDPILGFTAILCIALAAGSAAALNQWYEADVDALMKRTRGRPLPAGRMDRQAALHFGGGLGAFGGIFMGLMV